MEKQVLILCICIFAMRNMCSAVPADPGPKFVDYDVYRVESRLFPEGVLSVRVNPFNTTEIPRLMIWAEDAGQKWRLESSKLYTAFQLRPTIYESFVLEQEERETFLKWVSSFGHLGHHKLWYLFDAGAGFTQIKNKQFDTCLTALGMEQRVDAFPCTNSEDQQWKFTKLSVN